MLKIEIHECTPHDMLRAIRAACNELLSDTDLTTQAAEHNSRAVQLHAAAEAETDMAAAALSAHNSQTAPTVAEMIQTERLPAPTVTIVDEAHLEIPAPAAEDLDSSGAEWNPELHASTKTKNSDGTWKKRRGAGKAEDVPELPSLPPGGQVPPSVPDAPPPLPPATPAAPLVTMNDIYALITNGKAVLNDVIAAAQAMGFADVGAFSRDATPEQRAQLLQELTA